ncbi:MAG TPA: hypothetical protein VLK25_10120 [Allosphingosinicella sp.]|nr:hypothetical protein [Allosphingosinicella sp.]
MTAAWFFDALPGLLALLVAGSAYVSTRQLVKRSRHATGELPETPATEGAAAPAPDAADKQRAALEDAVAALRNVSMFDELGAARFSPFANPNLGYLTPRGGVTGSPLGVFNVDFLKNPYSRFFDEPWAGVIESDVPSRPGSYEDMVRLLAANRLLTERLVQAVRSGTAGYAPPDETEEAKEQS